MLVALFGPLAVCGVLLMAYNVARFGSPLEFGRKFQMKGGDGADARTFKPAYIPSGLYLYLLAPPRPTALFPFVRWIPFPPWRRPQASMSIDPTGGALVLAPVFWWIFLLPVLRRRMGPELRRLFWAIVGAGGVIVLGMSFLLWGTTQHYTADFMALLTIPALLVWMVFLSRTRRGSWRHRFVIGSGLLAVAWGSAVGLAIGLVGYQNRLEVNHPALFHRLEDIFSPVSVVQTRVVGRPVVGSIISPGDRPVGTWSGDRWGKAAMRTSPCRLTRRAWRSCATQGHLSPPGGVSGSRRTAPRGPDGHDGEDGQVQMAADRRGASVLRRAGHAESGDHANGLDGLR